jgi:hypothetical protein
MLTLDLKALPSNRVRGSYVINRIPGKLPLRSLFLHPLAADSFLADLADAVSVTDMFRSAEVTMMAIAAGRGTRLPGYSGHNFGFSIDIDLDVTLRERRLEKAAFDSWMAARGWHCERRDGTRGLDDHHYDFLALGEQLGLAPMSDPIRDLETLIVRVYGEALAPDPEESQRQLKKLRHYGGVVDGEIGPVTTEAIRIFQRAWQLDRDAQTTLGTLDARTRRTLAFVCCQRRLHP